MKKIYTLLLLTSLTNFFAQTYIPFTGTGALNANGWTVHSGTAGQTLILSTPSDSGNSLSFTGLAASTGNRTAMVAGNGEDLNFPVPTPLTGVIYYSALIKVLDATQLDLNSAIGSYGLALTNAATATTTTFQARIYTKQGTTPNTFSVGVLNNSGGTAAPSYISTGLAVNTTHLLVVKFDLATNIASLFVNPTPGSAEPSASATNTTGTTAAPTQIAGFVIRQVGTATAGSGNVEVDEVRVGDSFSQVTPANVATNQFQIAGLKVYVSNKNLNVTSDNNDLKSVAVYNILGKQVINTTTSGNTINVSELSSGVYIVKVTEEGKTATRKLVIQ